MSLGTFYVHTFDRHFECLLLCWNGVLYQNHFDRLFGRQYWNIIRCTKMKHPKRKYGHRQTGQKWWFLSRKASSDRACETQNDPKIILSLNCISCTFSTCWADILKKIWLTFQRDLLRVFTKRNLISPDNSDIFIASLIRHDISIIHYRKFAAQHNMSFKSALIHFHNNAHRSISPCYRRQRTIMGFTTRRT